MDRSTTSQKILFGGQLGWCANDWTASDDRVRGGSSQSYLRILEEPLNDHAIFTGTLDTQTLGGAGFASQRTTSDDRHWDLSSSGGISITYDPATSDDKLYTLIVKDTLLPPDPDTGREQSTISWEYDFRASRSEAQECGETDLSGLVTDYVSWDSFKPTYRGREAKNPSPLRTEDVRRISIMMRSFFNTQSGPFKLKLISIATFESTSKVASDMVAAAACTGDFESRSTTTTLQGDNFESKFDSHKSDTAENNTSSLRGLFSKLLCH